MPLAGTLLYRELEGRDGPRWQITSTGQVALALGLFSFYLALETKRRKRAEQSLNASLQFEQVIAELSTHFINMPSDKIDAGITDALDRLVAFLQVDRASVFEFSPDCTELIARHAKTAPHIVDGPAVVHRDQCAWLFSKLLGKESIVVNTLKDLPDEAEDLKLLYERFQAKSNVLVPMEAEGSVLGCLSIVLFAKERFWPERLVRQLNLVGQVFANALLRKRADEERFELMGRLINAQEEERHRIARELHDDFNQRIAVIAADLERLPQNVTQLPAEAKERLRDLGELVTEIGADVHTLSHSLHSSTLDTLGLVEALDSLCEDFTEQSDIRVEFSHERVPRPVSPEISLCLFRIVQEGLRNIRKHSGASEVEVRVESEDGGLHLSLRDNGAGFLLSESSKKVGLGLRSMEERVRLVSGRLQVQSAPGVGTQISAWIPLDGRNSAGSAVIDRMKQEDA
jgi:signal transduction histidine kinase